MAERSPNQPLRGRVATVTGSGRNIGAAVAKGLAARGAAVMVNVRSSEEQGRGVVERIRKAGCGAATLVVADVSTESGAERLIDACLQEHGRLDILVNNVGIAPMHRIEDTTRDIWEQVLRTSLSSAFFCIRKSLPAMSAQGWGRIVNVGGQAGLRGTPFKVANAAAKAGLIGLTRAVANEVADRGITCNHVGPGLLESSHERPYYPSEADQLDPDFRNRWLRSVPIGRRGTAEDVAAACLFLASEEASYITGQTLLVNGGMMFV